MVVNIRILAAVSALAAAVLLLAACGAGGDIGSQTDRNENAMIRLMSPWPDNGSLHNRLVERIIDEYMKEYPGITISTEALENELYKDRLKVLSASNALPDVGFSWAAGFLDPYVEGNLFTPLDDLLEDELRDLFVAGTTEMYEKYGKTYAVPVELNIVPIFYNKDIFARYGLTPPQTFEELKEIIRRLNDAGVTPISLGGKDAWTLSFWFMYLVDRVGGAELLDQSIATASFTDPRIIEAARLTQELVGLNAFPKGFMGMSNEEAKSWFMAELSAMYAIGTWEVPNYTTNPLVPEPFKDKIGFFPFPLVEGGQGKLNNWIGGPGVGLFVAENSKVKTEAKKFVAYFVKKWGELAVNDAGIIPATKVDTSAVHQPRMYIDLLKELSTANKVTLYADVQMKPVAAEEHYTLVQALFGGAVTPEEFARGQEAALVRSR
jgi:raffinose/stachyose/melibiose transport system substrate-binding protein